MDKIMLDIDAQVKAAIEKTAARMDKCETLLRGVIGEQALRLDAEFQNLKYRSQRLATVSDILNGKAYTVVEGKHHELFVQKGKDAKLISLAEKMGLNAEFIQGKADLP